MSRRPLPARSATVLLAGVLAACGSSTEPAEDVELVTTASVLQKDGSEPQLCWAMAESMPPQCSGPGVAGWDWETVEGEQETAGTTWIDVVRLHGTFDGRTFTPTRPPDVPDGDVDSPFPPCVVAGEDHRGDDPMTDAELRRLLEKLGDVEGFVAGSPGDGVVELQVVSDVDGALQRRLDAEHGAGVVVVDPMMCPVGDAD